MNGLHLTADLYECRCAPALLREPEALAAQACALTQAAGLRIVSETWHRFADAEQPDGGYTGVLLLAESHLAVHTWPELGAVTLDVYVCNHSADHSAQARGLMQALQQLFAPTRVQAHALERGRIHGLDKNKLGENP